MLFDIRLGTIYAASIFTWHVSPEVLQHPRPVAVLVHAGRVVAGLGSGDQGPEGDGAHSHGPHVAHGGRSHRGPESGLRPRARIEAGPCSPEGKGPVSAGGEAGVEVVDPEEAEVECVHVDVHGGRGREAACGAREASEAGRGYAAHCAVAGKAARCAAPASLGLSEVQRGGEGGVGDPVQRVPATSKVS